MKTSNLINRKNQNLVQLTTDSLLVYKASLTNQKKFQKLKDPEHLLYLNDRLDQLISQSNKLSQSFLSSVIKISLKMQMQYNLKKMRIQVLDVTISQE